MFKQFILLLVPFLFAGCGNAENKPDLSNTAPEKDPLEEAVDWAKIQNRNGDAYLPNTDFPYSGWAKRTFENGQVEVLAEFTNGSVTRLKQWKKNGIPKWDISYSIGKVGNKDVPIDYWSDSDESFHNGTCIRWHTNGQKQGSTNYKDGKLHGLSNQWYQNGQKQFTANFKDGDFKSVETWKPNGEKCPTSNISGGNGALVWYDENGKENFRMIVKNGKVVN